MRIEATNSAPAETDADTIVVGIFADEGEVAHDTPDGALAALLASGEAKGTLKKVALTHSGGKRWLLAGLGKREELDGEKARVTAAVAAKHAAGLGARRLCWELPHDVADEIAGALVEGTVLAAFRFEQYKSPPKEEDERPPELEELLISAHHDVSAPVARAAVIAEAVNAARVLQNTPGNDMTPTALGERAKELAAELDGLTCEVEGRATLLERGMNAFAAVAQGTDQEPALITLRYEGPRRRARSSASSARPSRSTAAASRSSRERR
jgi:leucyl aminopeptidase